VGKRENRALTGQDSGNGGLAFRHIGLTNHLRMVSRLDRYEPVSGTIPTRPRSDYNPLDRDEYLRRVARNASHTMNERREAGPWHVHGLDRSRGLP
jgi:hypothetical protein